VSEPRVYQVRHCTEYTYDDDVTASYGRAYLTPRDTPRDMPSATSSTTTSGVGGQWCRSTRIEVEPTADVITESVDFFGNRSAYVEVHAVHRRLVVTATSLVEVTRQAPDLARLDAWTWEAARDAVRELPDVARLPSAAPSAAGWGVDPVEARAFLLPSPQVPQSVQVTAYAATVFTPGRPLGQALAALMHTIHTDFTYASGATSVSTTLTEVLRKRKGVCQDFAHLAVGCLRSVGLPARYVSGYLETQPPPGRPRLQGADASHAWASVLVPELGWTDLDPTNDQPADGRYVVTAWGRDYTDVPPLRGVIFTESTKSTLEVAVDVVRQ
jgi:transglutaminase-like putative cysteine protease